MSHSAYFNLDIPAPRRLAMMRADYAGHAKPASWRAVRGWTHKTWQSAFATLSRGLNDGRPIWYTQNGPEFRDERNADDIVSRLPRGWYTDPDCSDTAVGIVARLTHGRFIAGYRWASNDERVYFPDVFTDEDVAARRADSHAEWFADQARGDGERFNAMQDAESKCEDKAQELRKAIALRHDVRFGGSDSARDAIEELRAARDELRDATAAYERGRK